MDDIEELYYLFPQIKENIKVEKKVGQGEMDQFLFYVQIQRRPAS
jgi:hypothetical protein